MFIILVVSPAVRDLPARLSPVRRACPAPEKRRIL